LVNLTGRNHLGDLGTDGIMISKLVLRKMDTRVWTAFIRLRPDWDRLEAPVNIVTNLWVSSNAKISLTS
jgi:hypothetical protein